MATAYCVIHLCLDDSGSATVPVFHSVRIYSEWPVTSLHPESDVQTLLAKATGETYERARANLLADLRVWYPWALAWIRR